MTNERESVAKIVKRHDAEELQAPLRYVAEKAGYTVNRANWPVGEGFMVYDGDDEIYEGHPLSDSLSDAEVTVVLGWLAKAGYWTEIPPRQEGEVQNVQVSWEYKNTGEYLKQVEESGESVNEALANALKALPREENSDS